MPLLCNDFDRQSLQDGGHWGGGAGHGQSPSGVSELHDARCVAVECVWLRVWCNWIVFVCVFSFP